MTNGRSCTHLFLCLGLAALTVSLAIGQEPAAPVKVTIKDGKLETAELPIDPTVRIHAGYTGGMYFGLSVDGTRITCTPESSIWSSARIDGQEFMPGFNAVNGQLEQPRALPPGPFGKKRLGTSVSWSQQNVHFTQIVELVPSRVPAGMDSKSGKRRIDTARITYVVENKDSREHEVAYRVFVDTMINNNDGALFAAPTTHPGQVLDGILLKEKTLPEYMQVLENPNLKNPGFIGVMTLKFGGKVEGPNKVVLANTGALNFGQGGWEVAPQKAGGDSAVFIYWAAKKLKPKEKRELIWAYGGGIASGPESDGRVSVGLSGSFEPGKSFTITATVEDPVPGQALTLELPDGMQLLEGKERQPVPTPGESGTSLVLWKARVAQLGDHELRIRSSTGVTQVKNISIQAGK
ncbi:MAG: hypothetical protein HY040_28495 [Planctomycetes bacterium]|nr:hypothetical protein [Planctomycetota bacterium]